MTPTDTNQPDHIVDIHEMVTDTNQASEDEPINQHLVCLWQLQDIEETIADAEPEELVDLHSKLVALSTDITEAVQALIRTEKLKLLAEVRSNLLEMRELKENRDDKGILWGSYDVVDLDDIQGLLTKLEAEL